MAFTISCTPVRKSHSGRSFHLPLESYLRQCHQQWNSVAVTHQAMRHRIHRPGCSGCWIGQFFCEDWAATTILINSVHVDLRCRSHRWKCQPLLTFSAIVYRSVVIGVNCRPRFSDILLVTAIVHTPLRCGFVSVSTNSSFKRRISRRSVHFDW